MLRGLDWAVGASTSSGAGVSGGTSSGGGVVSGDVDGAQLIILKTKTKDVVITRSNLFIAN